jgi:hypothetical protein
MMETILGGLLVIVWAGSLRCACFSQHQSGDDAGDGEQQHEPQHAINDVEVGHLQSSKSPLLRWSEASATGRNKKPVGVVR